MLNRPRVFLTNEPMFIIISVATGHCKGVKVKNNGKEELECQEETEQDLPEWVR
jgi:hypothetical protein